MAIAMTKMVSAMLTIQSSSPIDIASKNHTRLFIVYVVILVAAAVFTVLLFRAGKLTQQAIRADADARIAEANQKAAEANQRAAEAQKELAQIQERFRPRTLSQREQNDLFGLLRAYSSLARQAREKNRETLWIVHPNGDTEATEFASMLTGLFVQAGWQPNLRAVPLSTHVVGLEVMVDDPRNPPLFAQALLRVLEEARMPFVLRQQKSSDNRTWFVVGSKH